ncbi:hypothetical protein JVT61DRAFT_15168 [Boletus reticuloceps]|uniref:Uncharacterized protein n=1 Tax=Boletus reticuloceps TaxID=495285 RepID=A0A8I2YTZ8_9AGAM|nr:hypothetical protein JVT61DRAFT_15168 [Boletus reticuloceps]
MSSPIPHSYASASRTDSEASPSSPGLYVPVHRRRRTPGYASSSESGTPTSSPASSPSSSARSLSPLRTPTPTPMPGIYTSNQLLILSHSPLIAQMSAAHVEALRAVAPEVVQTRKQRKALAWRARQATATVTQHAHRQTPSRGSHSQSQSESEEDRAVSWRIRV